MKRNKTLKNLRMGLLIGVGFAVVFSLWVTFLFLMFGQAPFEEIDTTYGTVIIQYFGGFLTGGLILGLLWPLRRWRLGAVLLGFVGVFPVYLLAFLLDEPMSEWFPFPVILGAVPSLIVGGGVGLVAWYDHYGRGR